MEVIVNYNLYIYIESEQIGVLLMWKWAADAVLTPPNTNVQVVLLETLNNSVAELRCGSSSFTDIDSAAQQAEHFEDVGEWMMESYENIKGRPFNCLVLRFIVSLETKRSRGGEA